MKTIPVNDIIKELDSRFSENDMKGAGELLEYWEGQAQAIGDLRGEITVQSELMGYYRKMGEREKGLRSVERGLELLKACRVDNTVSGATVILNAATTMKAFGKAEEALPFYEKAREVLTRGLDKKNPLLAGLCNNMALALVDVGDFGRAGELYENALEILSGSASGLLDSAVTWVNMAHMYESEGKTERIADCMSSALLCLCDTSIQESGYMAYVYSKCAPSFAHFGDGDTAAYLSKVSEELYARARRGEKL